MRILNINNFNYNRGGATKYYLSLARILKEHGHTVLPFSTKSEHNIPSDCAQHFVHGYTSETFGGLSIARKAKAMLDGIYSLEARRNIERLITESEPDLAHIHNIYYQISPSILHSLRKLQVPVVYSLHDYNVFCAGQFLYNGGALCRRCRTRPWTGPVQGRCYKNSRLLSLYAMSVNRIHTHLRLVADHVDTFLVPTDVMKQEVAGWGLRPEKIRVIQNPFLYDDIQPSLTSGDYVLFFGSLIQPKGILTLLKAMERIPRVKLIVAGKDEALEGKNIAGYIRDHGLHNIELRPHIRWGTGLQEMIDKAMYVVIPSEWPVPMDYTLLEAMAYAKPVVVSDSGGNQTLVRNGWNGAVFKAGDPADLAAKMLDLMEDPSRLIEFGKNGRAVIEAEFGSRTYYSGIMRVYGELLDKNDASARKGPEQIERAKGA